jgi:DNA polymerase-3 subunit alpha
MANISQFTESKNGRRKISYPDPSLEEVLKETYGVIVYQEQVMQVAQIIAGFTLAHADELRRAMGKKIMEKMIKEKVQFINGAKERGYDEKKAEEIFELLIPFAGYGFNKSHAAAYAVLAYKTAYLKAHFPAEFIAANLSNEINSADKNKLSQCINEGRKMGIPIDPPDINLSDKLFAVVNEKIIYGFLGIKGIGLGPADEIIEKRQNGPFKSFMDFLDRVTLQSNQSGQHIVSRKVIELLIRTGAFDRFGINRPTLLANMEAAIDYAQKKKDEGKFGQVSLFGETDEKTFPDFEFTQMPEMDRMEQLAIEKDLLGFYFSGHPLDSFRKEWEEYVNLDTSRLNDTVPGNYIIMGILKTLKPQTDKTGKAMAFAALEDYRGEMDLAFFCEAWEASRQKLQLNDIIAVKGKVDRRRGGMSLQVGSVLSSAELKEGMITTFGSGQAPQIKNREALDKYHEVWKQNMTLDLSAPSGDTHVLVGVLSSLRPHLSRNQKEMAFGTLEDYQGRIDLVFFEQCWEHNKDKLIENTCMALKGKLDMSRSKPSFIVSSLLDIGKMRRSAEKAMSNALKTQPETISAGENAPGAARKNAELHIKLHTSAAKDEKILFPLRDYLIDNPGAALVFIHVGEKIIRTGLNFAAGGEQLAVLGENPIVEKVWVACCFI